MTKNQMLMIREKCGLLRMYATTSENRAQTRRTKQKDKKGERKLVGDIIE